MKKIKLTESQLKSVIRRIIEEQTAPPASQTSEPAPVNIAQKNPVSEVVGKSITLISLPTRRRPEGINWGKYNVVSANPDENGTIVFMVQEVSETGKKRWGQLQLIYDPQSPDELFLKNEMENTGKIVTCMPLTNFLKKINQPSE